MFLVNFVYLKLKVFKKYAENSLIQFDSFFQEYLPYCSSSKYHNLSFFLFLLSGYPKMEVNQEYYGMPPPPVGFGQALHLSRGDVIELTRADAELPWWEVGLKNIAIYMHSILHSVN